jgi:hypothetical protein
VRDVFGAAWSLFQVCLPTCLPLAVIAVAISVLGTGSAAAGQVHGALYGPGKWGVIFARTLLVLICYGAVLRQQLTLAAGARPRLLDSLRDATSDLPAVAALAVAWVLPFLPAIATTAWRGFDLLALLLTTAACGLLVYLLPAWPAMVAARANPWVALTTAISLVRGRWLQFAGVVLVLVAGVLVFALLASILIGMVMNLAGQGIHPTSGGLAFSNWLIAIVLALPVLYAGAVAVVAWRTVSSAQQP